MGAKKDIDWNAVKNAYITDAESSFRSLSEEFGISASAIHRRAKEGDWAKKRERFSDKLETDTLEKLKQERAKGEARRLKRLYKAAEKLTVKIEKAIDKADPRNTLAIRQLTTSLKEMMNIEGVSVGGAAGGEEGENNTGVVVLAEIGPAPVPPEIDNEDSDGEEKKNAE